MRGLWALCLILSISFFAAHGEDRPPFDDGGSVTEPLDGEEEESADGVGEEAEEEDTEEESVWQEEQISSEQIRGLHKKIDANSDGKISMAEITDFDKASRHEIAKKQMVTTDGESMHDEIDADKDGKISLDEMLTNIFGHPAPEAPDGSSLETPDEHMEQERNLETQKFKAADKNGDGFLDKEELPAAIRPELHDHVFSVVASHMMKLKDKDGDGQLSSEEFWEGDENDEIAEDQAKEFEMLDLDKSGKLNLEEFTNWESGSYHTADAMTQLFEIADEDKDHHITAAELDAARPVLANSVATSHLAEWAEHYEL